MVSDASYGVEDDIRNFREVISNIITPGRYEKYEDRWGYYVSEDGFPGNRGDEYLRILEPTLYKTLGVTKIGDLCADTSVSLGGMCLLSTGDIKTLREGYLPDESRTKISSLKDVTGFVDNYLPRIDQVMDSIGPTRIKNNVVVFEDSIFADLLTGMFRLDQEDGAKVQKSFRRLGERSERIIENFLRRFSGEDTRLIPVYTSDIENDLAKYVSLFSRVIGDSKFGGQGKAAVELMYTYMWPRLLKENGYIVDDKSCMIVEPFAHFIDSFTNITLPYVQKLEWYFRTNPLGGEGENKNLYGAGFIPALRMMKGKGKSPFSRDAVCSETINSKNFKTVTDVMKRDIDNPFPSCENSIFRAGVNALYYDKTGRNMISGFSDLEREYRREKSELKISGATDLGGMKKYYSDMARPMLENILSRAVGTFAELGFA